MSSKAGIRQYVMHARCVCQSASLGVCVINCTHTADGAAERRTTLPGGPAIFAKCTNCVCIGANIAGELASHAVLDSIFEQARTGSNGTRWRRLKIGGGFGGKSAPV